MRGGIGLTQGALVIIEWRPSSLQASLLCSHDGANPHGPSLPYWHLS